MSSSTNLFVRLPNNSDVELDRYVTPFSYGLWLAVAFTICAIRVCLALINYGRERNQNLTLSTTLFNIHACFCRQGQSDESCCFTSLFLYVLILYHRFNNISLWFKLVPHFPYPAFPSILEQHLLSPVVFKVSLSIPPTSFHMKTKMDSLQCYGQRFSCLGLAASDVLKGSQCS